MLEGEPPKDLQRVLHKTIKKVGEDTGDLSFNTAISQMMIFTNELFKVEENYRAIWEPFVRILTPYAPHMGEELWEKLGNPPPVSLAEWPAYDEELTKDEELEIVLQVNGKVRAKVMLPAGLSKEDLQEHALSHDRIQEWVAGKKVRKVVAVPDKLVNVVVG
jgi:leucyl-tRNA synthetase